MIESWSKSESCFVTFSCRFGIIFMWDILPGMRTERILQNVRIPSGAHASNFGFRQINYPACRVEEFDPVDRAAVLVVIGNRIPHDRSRSRCFVWRRSAALCTATPEVERCRSRGSPACPAEWVCWQKNSFSYRILCRSIRNALWTIQALRSLDRKTLLNIFCTRVSPLFRLYLLKSICRTSCLAL